MLIILIIVKWTIIIFKKNNKLCVINIIGYTIHTNSLNTKFKITYLLHTSFKIQLTCHTAKIDLKKKKNQLRKSVT